MRVAIVIPVYNEVGTLAELVDRVLRAPAPTRTGGETVDRLIVLVDDGSTDGSGEEVRRLAHIRDTPVKIATVHHKTNMGKGAALRSGFRAALQHGADVVLVQDADLEYDPLDHNKVLAPILSGKADAVIGSRFIGGEHRVLYFWHAVANRFITLLSNMLTNLNLTDIECCSKALTREVVEKIRIEENAFGVEPELVAKVARLRLPSEESGTRAARVYEVGVSYAGRTYAEGKKITWRDGVSALRCILEYNLARSH